MYYITGLKLRVLLFSIVIILLFFFFFKEFYYVAFCNTTKNMSIWSYVNVNYLEHWNIKKYRDSGISLYYLIKFNSGFFFYWFFGLMTWLICFFFRFFDVRHIVYAMKILVMIRGLLLRFSKVIIITLFNFIFLVYVSIITCRSYRSTVGFYVFLIIMINLETHLARIVSSIPKVHLISHLSFFDIFIW